MINFRIIPKLEIKNENLVKGVNHEGLRVFGDPLLFISEYLKITRMKYFYKMLLHLSMKQKYHLISLMKF